MIKLETAKNISQVLASKTFGIGLASFAATLFAHSDWGMVIGSVAGVAIAQVITGIANFFFVVLEELERDLNSVGFTEEEVGKMLDEVFGKRERE